MATESRVTRREFIKQAAVGGAAGLVVGAGGTLLLTPQTAAAAALSAPVSKQTDVIVAGAGIGGLTAAVKIAQAGVKVILIEASKKVGGTALFSSGSMGLLGFASYEDMIKKTPLSDPELGKAVFDSWEPMKKWLAEIAIPTKPLDTPAGYLQLGAQPIPNGPRLYLNALKSAFDKFGGETLLETKAVKLLTDAEGAVVGLRAASDSAKYDIKAKAVILATGGFQGNKELLIRYLGPDADLTVNRAVPYNDGSGLLMGIEVGATCSRGMGTHYGHLVAFPPNVPQDPKNYEAVDAGALNELMSNIQAYSAWSLAINLNGQRFIDESLGDDLLNQAVGRQPQALTFTILDKELRDKYVGRSVITSTERMELLSKNGAAIISGATLEELAGNLAARGVHKANFLKTVSEFNKAVDEKRTMELPVARKGNLKTISVPPFYAIPATAGVSQLFGGLRINTKSEVLGRGGMPIPGLYAIPGTAGGIMHTNFWCCLSGNSVFGYIAGQTAAKAVAST